jgi:GNAT acetyltransferase-like protein
MQIEILPSSKIDKQKWDDCIKNSSNPLIYATSVYLDYMAENWDGFIADDYSLVMPVPWRKKYGIKYCYTVPFVQQLGVFGKNFKQEDVDLFIKRLQETFRYGDYACNYLNQTKTAKQSNNYILLLSSKYEVLKQFYLLHLEKNLHKAKKFPLQYEEGEIEEVIELFKEIYANRIKNITSQDYKNFYAICKIKQQENNIVVRKVTNNNQLLASVLLMKDERRYYNLMMCATEIARQQSAGAFLYNELIKEFSHSGMMIDFEGSDIPGIEFFYKGFGAVNQPYYKLHLNSLAFPLRLFKR